MVLYQIDRRGTHNLVGPPFCRRWRQNGGPTRFASRLSLLVDNQGSTEASSGYDQGRTEAYQWLASSAPSAHLAMKLVFVASFSSDCCRHLRQAAFPPHRTLPISRQLAWFTTGPYGPWTYVKKVCVPSPSLGLTSRRCVFPVPFPVPCLALSDDALRRPG